MKGIYNNILASCLIGIILFSGCSVTKHLPEGEVLYTGGKTVVENKSATPVGETALTEIDAALDKTPSTKMLGGLLPIPFKMWMYNDFVKYKKGFGTAWLPILRCLSLLSIRRFVSRWLQTYSVIMVTSMGK